MQHRNFQLFIAGQLISLIGTWMQNMAQLWLVYQLTHSAALLGVFGFASQVPMLFLSSLGGYVGDRFDRHRGVIVTQTITMLLAFVLAGLTWAHLIGKWNLIVIAFLVGIVNAFDVPIRQAFFVQMVGKEDLPNAIALNSSIFNAARAVGPAIAGFAIALVGAGGCFFLNGLSFVAVIVALHFAARTHYKGLARWIAATSTTCAICLIIFSQAKNFALCVAVLFVVGFAATSQMAATNTLIQNRVPDELRSRVMAVYATMFMGVQPMGALIAGAAAKHIGPQNTLTVFGSLVLLGSLIFIARVVMRLGKTQTAEAD